MLLANAPGYKGHFFPNGPYGFSASWNRVPGDKLSPDPIPDLAVEVISIGNTAAEMERKRREYFTVGCSAVWMIDPRSRTVEVFSSADDSVTSAESDTLDAGDVLPGFSLTLRALFAELDRHG